VKQINRHIVLKIFSFLLIVSIGIWTASKSVFYHAHLLQKGKIIYHSHPYNTSNDSTPFKSHEHTDAQLVAIDHLNIIIFAVIVQFLIVLTKKYFKHTQQKFDYTEINICNTLGRSPPSFLFA
jgi:hypothetical protein